MQSDTDSKKYSWSFKDGKMNCCTSETSTCNVSKLWEVTGLTQFHDAQLQHATKKINAILDRLEKGNRDKSRYLSFVQHRNRLLLIWAGYGRIGPDDDSKTIRKALKLRK